MASEESRPNHAAASHLALFLAVLALNLWIFRYFLVTLAAAASIAILLSPLYERFSIQIQGRRSVAAGLAVAAVGFVILVPLVIYGAILADQAVAAYDSLRPHLEPEALSTIWSDELPERYPWIRTLQEFFQVTELDGAIERVIPALSNLAAGVNQVLQRAVTELTTAILYMILFLLALFFLLRDGRLFAREMAELLPFSRPERVEIFDRVARTVKGVLYSMVVVPIAQGLLAMLGFWIFSLPSPLLWGTFVVFAAVIPGIGAPAVWGPAAIYLLFAQSWWQGVGLILYGTFIVGIADNIIKPVLLSGTAQIHAFLAFLAILGGLLTFGPAGFLLGPVIFSLLLSMVRIRRSRQPAPAPAGE